MFTVEEGWVREVICKQSSFPALIVKAFLSVVFCSYLWCFLVIFSDVSILVKAIHLRVGDDGESPDVIDVTLVRTRLWTVVSTTIREPERTSAKKREKKKKKKKAVLLVCKSHLFQCWILYIWNNKDIWQQIRMQVCTGMLKLNRDYCVLFKM